MKGLFPDIRRFHFHRIDGELGTDDFAVMAVDALAGFGDHRRVVPLAVETVGKLEDVLGAELDAVAATLAPVVDNVHHSSGDLDILGIERDSPKCHVACLL
jgi:hypothetical protein